MIKVRQVESLDVWKTGEDVWAVSGGPWRYVLDRGANSGQTVAPEEDSGQEGSARSLR